MQISFAKSCKYHAIWKGLFSKCRRCRARGSISTMQVDVAECWTYCKCHANSVVCFQFFCLDGFTSFLSSWLCKTLGVSWLHGFVCVHLFTATKATNVRKSQRQPTPKQRPQHQQLLVCSSSYTNPNNNHNSNSNNNGRTPCNRAPARDKIPMARWPSVPFSTRLPLFRN